MEIFILLCLIILNGLFVITELSLVSAKKIRLEQLYNKGNLGAKKALELQENPEKFLATAQIGITLIAIFSGLYSGEKFNIYLVPLLEKIAFLKPYANTLAKVLIVVLVTFLSIIFGELMPKRIGMVQPEKIASMMAKPMSVFSIFMSPFVWILNFVSNSIFRIFNIKTAKDSQVTEEEIKAMITEGSESGAIDEDEKEIIERVFHLGDRNITSMMTHRADIKWFDEKTTVLDFKQKAQDYYYSSYPVCDGQIDEVSGLIHVKDILKSKDADLLKNIMQKANFVPENNTPYQVLEQFKTKKIHSCFIVNEYGSIEGMITLTDLLTAIVGEMPEIGQEAFGFVKRADGSFLVEAQLPFYDFLSYFEKTDLIEEEQNNEYDTVAGLCLKTLNKIPNVGDSFIWKNFSFEIIDMDGQRIDKILIINQEIITE